MGYGSIDADAVIELTYNYGVLQYDIGDGFGHIAIEVVDIHELCNKVKQTYGKVTREPAPMKFGGGRNIAFIEDPDGYKIELIEGNNR